MKPAKKSPEREVSQHGGEAISQYVAELSATFGKYAKSPAETRRALDKAMGNATLTDVLYEMRRDGRS